MLDGHLLLLARQMRAAEEEQNQTAYPSFKTKKMYSTLLSKCLNRNAEDEGLSHDYLQYLSTHLIQVTADNMKTREVRQNLRQGEPTPREATEHLKAQESLKMRTIFARRHSKRRNRMQKFDGD